MIYTINLNKQKCYSGIQSITGYIAKRSDSYDKVAVTDDEDSIIGVYYNCALTNLTSNLFEFKPVLLSDRINVEIPSNFEDSALKGVENEAIEFIVNSILAKWFVGVDSPVSKDYENKTVANIANVKSLLHQRKKPVR